MHTSLIKLTLDTRVYTRTQHVHAHKHIKTLKTINLETTVIYTHAYPLALSMFGLGQMSRLNVNLRRPLSRKLDICSLIYGNN